MGLRTFAVFIFAVLASIVALLFALSRPVINGIIYLKNAPGEVTIHYEAETGIAHIHG